MNSVQRFLANIRRQPYAYAPPGGINPNARMPVPTQPPSLPPQAMHQLLMQSQQPLRAPQSIGARLNSMLGSPGMDIPLGLLAQSGWSTMPTTFGETLAGASAFASQRQDERQRREIIEGELANADRERERSEQMRQELESIIRANARGPSPTLTKQQADFLSLGARMNPTAAYSAMAQIPGLLAPAPEAPMSESGRKATELEQWLGRQLTEKEALTVYGAGSLFDEPKADPADEPLSPNDLTRVRNDDGSPLPLGTTPRQAQNAGAKVWSEAELDQKRKMEAALNTLDTLEQMAVGPNGVFVDQGGSVITNNAIARLGAGVSNGLGSFFGTEASLRRDVYTDTARGSISSLVRSMGDAGALSDGDVQRALALIPELGATPDTEDKARAKFQELRRIIDRGVAKLRSPGADGTGGVKFLGFE